MPQAIVPILGLGYQMYASEKAQKAQEKAMQQQPMGYADSGYPSAAEMYGARYDQGGYSGYQPNGGSGTGAESLLMPPTTGGSISNIGSEAHMSSVPGAAEILNQNSRMGASPLISWF